MAPIGELLFWNQRRVGLDDVLRHNTTLLREKVDELPDKLFDEKSDDEIAAQLAVSEAIAPLELDLASAAPHVRETQFEVSDDYGFSGRGRIRVNGLEATKSVPFFGDPKLWECVPNPFDLNPPRGKIEGNRVVIGITVREQQIDEAKRYIDSTLENIITNIGRQKAQVDAYNASIARAAMSWIQQRRSRRGRASELLDKLR